MTNLFHNRQIEGIEYKCGDVYEHYMCLKGKMMDLLGVRKKVKRFAFG